MKDFIIVKISTGHAFKSQIEHWSVKSYKANKEKYQSDICPSGIIHFPGNFGKPVMCCSKKCKTGSSEHNKVEMSNYKMCVMKVDICSQGTKDKSGETSDHKYENKSNCP